MKNNQRKLIIWVALAVFLAVELSGVSIAFASGNDAATNNGGASSEVVAVSEVDFEPVSNAMDVHNELRLGNLITDSYRYAVNQTPSGMEHYADAAIILSGTLRGTFAAGKITAEDVNNSLSHDKTPEGRDGDVLVSMYFTGKELKTIVEIDASISDFKTDKRIYCSGISFAFNPARVILNKMNDIWLSTAMLQDSRTEIENDGLYRVIMDMSTAETLLSINESSRGFMKLTPKRKDGSYITDPGDAIVYKADGSELINTEALSQYLNSFEKRADGYSYIPKYYGTAHNRKIVDTSTSPIALLKHPNKFFFIFIGLAILLLLIIVLVIYFVIRHKQKQKVFINTKKLEMKNAAGQIEGEVAAGTAAGGSAEVSSPEDDGNDSGDDYIDVEVKNLD